MLSGLEFDGTQCGLVDWSTLRSPKMAQSDHDPEDGKQVPARPHDTGSQANETVRWTRCRDRGVTTRDGR